MKYTAHYDSPLGGITLASDGEALTGLWFDGQTYYAARLDKHAKEKALPLFDETGRWLNLYFAGQIPDFTPPLSFADASDFRRQVWEILLTIPYGKTRSYGSIAQEIAARSGKNPSAQAVGGAVGHNPISLLVPCHRVVGSGGNLTGYAGGLDKKIALLYLEKADTAGLFVPGKRSL